MSKNNCLLPRLIRKDNSITRSRQTVFGGLSSCPEASGQEITYMENLSPNAYPAIGTGETRFRYELNISGNPNGIYQHRNLIMALGEFLYELTEEGEIRLLSRISDTPKKFASFGRYLFTLPDGLCYDPVLSVTRALHSDTGILEEAEVGSNYISCSGVDWEGLGFEVNDGVQIYVKDYVLGSTPMFTGKVMAIMGSTLFLSCTFENTGTFSVHVVRPFPSMTQICAVGDRLMGCSGNCVYVCEAGNPFNWCASGGSADDPVIMETGGEGDFVACGIFQGYGIFFKKDRIYRLLGGSADDYRLTDIKAPGIPRENAESLYQVNGTLYYLSSGGVYKYEGDEPVRVGAALPYGLTGGKGCSDGSCYYLSAVEADGTHRLYAYHAERGMWYVQDEPTVASMTQWGDRIFIQTAEGELLQSKREGEPIPVSQITITETASVKPSLVVFGEEFGGSPDGLRLYTVFMRVCGQAGGELKLEISYDGEDAWETVDTVNGPIVGMVQMRLLPRRASSYRLRLSMTGGWRISEIVCEYEKGKQ